MTRLLRDYGVVGKFVEVFGEGASELSVTDRATISNMSPEFGCTNTHWPIDDQTLSYFRQTGRSTQAQRLEAYAKENLLWQSHKDPIQYSDVITLNLSDVETTISGPRRPQDKMSLKNAKSHILSFLKDQYDRTPHGKNGQSFRRKDIIEREDSYRLQDASVVIAAITSCTNTSNPSAMLGAGLIAKKAVERGLQVKPWVKTSLAPGSRVVTKYLKKAGLLPFLETLRFHVVGYGCTTCIGNSGDMPPAVQSAIDEEELVVAAVLSGNRNFEARIHPQIRMNFLASPMLVVAYALAGRVDIDMYHETLGQDSSGQPVYLKDLWPTQEEIDKYLLQVEEKDFVSTYETVFEGDETWKKLASSTGARYHWSNPSTYIQEAPFFKDLSATPTPSQDIIGARALLCLGDMVTTDHISPAGKFTASHPAGEYLRERGIEEHAFNSYGSRRGNHEVMMRGTFANVRIRNLLVEKEGGWTRHFPSREIVSVFEAATRYAETHTPLIVIGGKEYGSGSSRDWAAKGTALLGVRAVIAESFERIHRSNLVGMGVLPIEFVETNARDLGLAGEEHFAIKGLQTLGLQKIVDIEATSEAGDTKTFKGKLRLDAEIDIAYYTHGGILQYVIRQFLSKKS